jgi:hypothetical protein
MYLIRMYLYYALLLHPAISKTNDKNHVHLLLLFTTTTIITTTTITYYLNKVYQKNIILN